MRLEILLFSVLSDFFFYSCVIRLQRKWRLVCMEIRSEDTCAVHVSFFFFFLSWGRSGQSIFGMNECACSWGCVSVCVCVVPLLSFRAVLWLTPTALISRSPTIPLLLLSKLECCTHDVTMSRSVCLLPRKVCNNRKQKQKRKCRGTSRQTHNTQCYLPTSPIHCLWRGRENSIAIFA